ncbi:RNA 2',3'-cyclic phosphodiesterase [Enterobacteriaceae bacterium H20N1]|uniref:RNA 2',3'-cyclic phosphodiesterase n=1 Tax=Dryocola boscaweniae TaxID=2925397 RepID=A0A9X3AA02_9ENTR|nr:RNA 2',3'-cyclic phosphodiesterase [Dryocola boscaweniae]MCT4700924.1 RNA 2',3'-cyclic phosphodiesterase [Dryocola boscaweniae]MCT4718207.1 RNA 2',3'-cyclic phosphodiesterase [Dryocola boscaweniae]
MADTRRLFFALDMPAGVQRQIVQWRAENFPADAGRPVAAANLHLTLAFLGDVSIEKQKALCQLAGRIRQPGFTLTLDDAGLWVRSRVVWLGPRHASLGLIQPANMLRAQAARNGCYQSPQPYHPHVTLYRNVTQSVAIPQPNFRWQFKVEEFVLYESVFAQGRTRYQPLERWKLSNKEE